MEVQTIGFDNSLGVILVNVCTPLFLQVPSQKLCVRVCVCVSVCQIFPKAEH